MLRPILLAAAGLIVLAAASPSARMAAPEARLANSGKPLVIPYGNDRLQRIDFHRAANSRAPLVLFVHGGGWKRGDKRMMDDSAKLTGWQGKGYAVASVNYRLVPEAKVEDQARDIAAAIAELRRRAGALGIDPDRIVIVGHSAGAHLVGLVGTDPQWLRGEGLGMDAIRGVIMLDGACYDVPTQMGNKSRLMGDTYEQAFGTDPERQKALSPVHHAALPNAPAFLLLHVQRADGKQQSELMTSALRKAGTPIEMRAFAGRGLVGHMEINRKLGEPDYPATAVVDGWLAERLR